MYTGNSEYSHETMGLASRLALEEVRLCLWESTSLQSFAEHLRTRRNQTRISWMSTVPHELVPSVLAARDDYLGLILDTLSKEVPPTVGGVTA